MSKKDNTLKAAWIAAAALLITAIISLIPAFIDSPNGTNDGRTNISIKNVQGSSIITGNNNNNNEKK